MREYTYVRKAPKRKGPAYAPDALARVIDQWQNSPEWKAYAPATVSCRNYGLSFLDEFRRCSVKEITRAMMLAVRDRLAHKHGNGAANNFVDTASALFTFALDRGRVTVHPLVRVRRLKLGEWGRWPEAAIEYALKALPARYARAVTLGLYTGQRSSDCVRMKWSDYDGEGIAVVQQKTGEKLWIPCPAALKAAMATWPKTAVTILTSSRGQPWKVDSFQSEFHRVMRKHPQLNGLQFHGLRKCAAARLAEAGCTLHEIAAVTGHRTLAMVQHYTREADQRTRASAAIVKLDSAKRRNKG